MKFIFSAVHLNYSQKTDIFKCRIRDWSGFHLAWEKRRSSLFLDMVAPQEKIAPWGR
jgi:hypothetical protein